MPGSVELLDNRLDACFATLRSVPKAATKRAASHWQIYAAAAGSALARATTASASGNSHARAVNSGAAK